MRYINRVDKKEVTVSFDGGENTNIFDVVKKKFHIFEKDKDYILDIIEKTKYGFFITYCRIIDSERYPDIVDNILNKAEEQEDCYKYIFEELTKWERYTEQNKEITYCKTS